MTKRSIPETQPFSDEFTGISYPLVGFSWQIHQNEGSINIFLSIVGYSFPSAMGSFFAAIDVSILF
jgi:uncharacterized protein (DUF608 family)